MQRQSLWGFSNMPRVVQTHPGKRETTQDPTPLLLEVFWGHLSAEARDRYQSEQAAPTPGARFPGNCSQGLESVMG